MTASGLVYVVILHIENCRGTDKKTRNIISCALVDIVVNGKGKDGKQQEGFAC